MSRKERMAVAAYFYVTWFACIYMAQKNWDYWTLALPVALLMALQIGKRITLPELALATAVTVVGVLFDYNLWSSGWISAPGRDSFPVWLLSLWLLFAISTVLWAPVLNLSGIPAALLGMIFGPLSYLSGEAFQVLILTSKFSIGIYAAFWFVFFPLLLKATRSKWFGIHDRSAAQSNIRH